jgi:hypothetical protein
MVNPIALGAMTIGTLVFLFGVSAMRRSRGAGVVVALVGLALAALPFVVTFFLAEPAR